MARTDIIAFAQTLAAGLCDENQLDRYLTDCIRELGHSTDHLSNLSLVTGVAAQSVYTAPDAAVRVLGIFYGQSELYAETYAGLGSAAGQDWRGVIGDPISYTTIDTNDRAVRLFPVPVRAGEAFVPLTGLFGAAYPDYNVFFAHTEERTEVPSYLELYLALAILAREFTRDSTHQDYAFAAAAKMLASIALAAVQ